MTNIIKRNSIVLNITILFLLSLMSFITSSYFYTKNQHETEIEIQYNNVSLAISKILARYSVTIHDIEDYLESMNFQLTHEDKKSNEEFYNNYNSDFPISVGIKKYKSDIQISIYANGQSIAYIRHMYFHTSQYHIVTIIGTLFIILIYSITMQSLIPIRYLKQQIQEISNSGVVKEIIFDPKNKNEVGAIAYEFSKIMQQVIALGESRTLFLRSVMHELKTPITKGLIVTEMISDDKQKKILFKVFHQLNLLIDEFAKIEQFSSKIHNIQKVEFLFLDVMEEVYKIMMFDHNSKHVILNQNNDLIKADFDLFVICIKNLIDNAIKYSPDSVAFIDITKTNLIVKNKGEPLKMQFHEYFKPYFKNDKNSNSNGFGLGIYIIKNILDAQGFKFGYEYKNNYNIFTIYNCVVENFCNINKIPKKIKTQKSNKLL